MINFGITGPETIEELGINAKMNELQAAMGLCVLDEMEVNLTAREAVTRHYNEHLPTSLQRQVLNSAASANNAYMPIVFESESQALAVLNRLSELGITARRYFYPSLDQIELGTNTKQSMHVSRDIAKRILCLPIYADVKPEELFQITDVIKEVVTQ